MLTARTHKTRRSGLHLVIEVIVPVVFIGLIIFAVAKNWEEFIESLQLIRHVSLWFVVAEIALFALSMAVAALTYRLLALSKVHYKQLALLELAAAGLNRLLPAGSGSMGLHGLYLVKHRHTVAQATAVISVNNALGLVTHLTTLAVVIALRPSIITGLQLHVVIPHVAIYVAGAAVALSLGLLFVPVVRQKIHAFWVGFYTSLLTYRRRPQRIAGAVLSSMLATTILISTLYVALRAVGIDLPVLQIFVIYSVGVFFGAAAPTPGGLGGVEAGLVAGLLARGIEPAQALAGALLFRLVTYWLPLVAGTMAFFVSRSRKLF